MQDLCGEVRQHAQRSEHADERLAPPDIDQVCSQQRLPGGTNIGVDDHGYGIRHVVDGQELVGERSEVRLGLGD
jgi:hypothetical protein